MTQSDLGSLLNDFVDRVPEVTHAVAVATDGLLIARSERLPHDDADRAAAVSACLVNLLHSAAPHLQSGGMVSNLTELESGFMFCRAAGAGGSLLALASARCDVDRVSHELADLIDQVRPVLNPPSWTDASAAFAASYRPRG